MTQALLTPTPFPAEIQIPMELSPGDTVFTAHGARVDGGRQVGWVSLASTWRQCWVPDGSGSQGDQHAGQSSWARVGQQMRSAQEGLEGLKGARQPCLLS